MGKIRATPPHFCNILHLGESARQLWQFNLAGNQAVLTAEDRSPATAALPFALVTKTWRSLWQRKINVAWLPADQVFLRVVQLPACAPEELSSIVELQLEKLSPIPLNQAVWSFELVPSNMVAVTPAEPTKSQDGASPPPPPPGMQTVVVIIVARNLAENLLGQLESHGYLADRLEFPALHHLLATPIDTDGVWIYPGIQEGKNTTLLAWWTNHNLQQLTILNLPSDERWIQCVHEHLSQVAWSAEMEGWLKGTTGCHLVAEPGIAAVWEPVLNAWSPTPTRILSAPTKPELAALSAGRLMRNESRANVLPSEFAVRYRQQFTDRLWMRGLGAIVVVYLAAVLVYFAALEVLKYQFRHVQNQVKASTADYEKVGQLKARGEVLQNQADLRYAALDCWKAASELLPEDITLNSLSFQRGKLLMISGVVPVDQVTNITVFNQALATVTVGNKRLFSKVNPPVSQASAGSQTYSWNFTCELDTPDKQ
jgi:hypothetical protein